MQYKDSNVTSKNGINFIRTIAESTACLFHKIEQENDLGIDCIIEFTKNEKPMHKSIAAQIKSGKSYYNSKKNQCIIPIKSHYEYWTNYPLPVYGFVYVPELEKAYYVNIKNHLKNTSEEKTITFDCTRSNVIDLQSFVEIFIPGILGEISSISFETALSFFKSEKPQEFFLGAKVLFRRYKNNLMVWDEFIDYIYKTESEGIDLNIIFYLSHIPWHPDIFHYGEILTEESRKYAKEKIRLFDKSLVLKMLELIDPEQGIVRGSIGQSIEAILSNISDIIKHLEEIIVDTSLKIEVREFAGEILAYYQGKKSLSLLETVKSESEIISNLIEFLKKYKSYNPYQ